MSQYFKIHPQNPQLHLVRETVHILEQEGVIVMPTDSAYALTCKIGSKKALTRIRQIRNLDNRHHFTLLCRDLSEVSVYANISNPVFRLLKAYTPGPYTYLLSATREVPRIMLHPKRKTIGLRIPSHPIPQAILQLNDAPLLSCTLIMPGDDLPLIEPQAIYDILGPRVDLIIDGGYCGIEPTSIIDLTDDIEPKGGRGGGYPWSIKTNQEAKISF